MIILLKAGATRSDADELLSRIADCGLKPLYMPGTERTVLGAIGDERVLASLHLENYPCVDRVTPILTPYKLVSREAHPADTIVHIGSIPIGGEHFAVIAGPCAVENADQMALTAGAVRSAGAHLLRGGAFKPRSSPYSFQGLGLEGLKILKNSSLQTGLPTITEVVEVADVEAVETCADAFQVGARNMQNFRLLKAVGQSLKPVVLKRGMAAKLDDLLLAAEYIVSEGNPRVILCERGIRTFETATRNTLDLSAVPYLKQKSHLPVIVDPSHATGVRDLVLPMAKAAVVAGADGVMIEVHHNPKEALSDGAQSLSPEDFARFMETLPDLLKISNKRQG
ncbi:MAG TPA: 3-deoxy-7-phosphoheptulonate synthase [bacterium]|nr:3-deoxy-7-phosphoheptulonate synthase [bacterium]